MTAHLRYLSPFDDVVATPVPAADRPSTLSGVRVGLLDISKPKGDALLDAVEQRLRRDHDVADVVRLRKPTFARPAPEEVLSEAERCGAVLVALAD